MSRFEYVAYDEKANADQAYARSLVTEVEKFIEARLLSPRAKALAITKLEECYTWIGKAVRDDMLSRTKAASEEKA